MRTKINAFFSHHIFFCLAHFFSRPRTEHIGLDMYFYPAVQNVPIMIALDEYVKMCRVTIARRDCLGLCTQHAGTGFQTGRINLSLTHT